MSNKKIKDDDLLNFVQKTTEAITVISESTKRTEEVTRAIKDSIGSQNTINAVGFAGLSKQVGGLETMFKYVILPLVTGILALVGIKMIFKL